MKLISLLVTLGLAYNFYQTQSFVSLGLVILSLAITLAIFSARK